MGKVVGGKVLALEFRLYRIHPSNRSPVPGEDGPLHTFDAPIGVHPWHRPLYIPASSKRLFSKKRFEGDAKWMQLVKEH